MPNGKQALYLLPLLLFLFLVCSELVERSMYTDGVAYAGLSNNLARGVGDFWNPKLSEVHHFSFHEHPPLVFGIQSLFFRVFGGSIVTERIYALTVFLLSALLLVVLWREVLRDRPGWRRYWFFPLTVWLANEVVYHFYPANVLEPTMTLFTLAAVYCSLRSLRGDLGAGAQAGLAVMAGLLIFGGTLCKGFVALFPLGFYAIFWLVYRRISPLRAVGLTVVLTATVGLAYLLLLQYEPARESLRRYFDSQVMASLTSERSYERHHRPNRFYIIGRTFEVLLPAFLLVALLCGLAVRRAGRQLLGGEHLQPAFLFLTLGVAASFPLAVSPKQSFYYLLPSMAYFALGFGLFAVPAVDYFYRRTLSPRATGFAWIAAAVLLLAALGNTWRHWGEVTRRDRVVLHDIDRMNRVIPAGTTVATRGDIAELVSYFYRTAEVSLDTTPAHTDRYEYLIAAPDVPVTDRPPVILDTEKYRLFGPPSPSGPESRPER